MIDFSALLSEGNYEHLEETWQPSDLPPSIRDIEKLPCMDMSLHCADPCPNCGAFNMRVGDYVCYGMCEPCEVRIWNQYKELV